MIAVIKSEAQYEEVLARVSALVEHDPPSDSPEGRELEVLALLISSYEERIVTLAPPSPIAALRLRMDQLGLQPKDLVRFLGTRSRVSEVLSGKRPLSLSMIRTLHEELGIPLKSLVAEEVDAAPTDRIEWDRFPVKEMLRRGWLRWGGDVPSRRIDYTTAQTLMGEFLAPVGGPGMALNVLHKADSVRTSKSSDRFALAAWAAFVRRQADRVPLGSSFVRADWGPERLRELRSLSRFDVGPRLATQFLGERGIAVVFAQHLPRTRLDGAAMLRTDGAPVIGMTLRLDRLDNFWFTLFHELMHVLLHLIPSTGQARDNSVYLDDLEIDADVSSIEEHADDSAREALIPSEAWHSSAVRYVVAPLTVSQLAREVGVAEAIVAGRVRHETGNFRLLSSMIGTGYVEVSFPEFARNKS